jgi:hypothetical protein
MYFFQWLPVIGPLAVSKHFNKRISLNYFYYYCYYYVVIITTFNTSFHVEQKYVGSQPARVSDTVKS